MKLEINPIMLILRPNRHFWGAFGHILACILMATLFFHGKSHALYLGSSVTAYRVDNGSIIMDGRPDLVWKAIGARLKNADTISFKDYSKIVLLQSDPIRNANPATYYNAPAKGSVIMMAAYDNTALYFFFLVKENTLYNPASLCTATKLWQANAAEVYIDPAPWDISNYFTYFSVDGSSLLFGTSPKTLQLNKPIHPSDSRIYFRNRSNPQDRFQIPTSVPNGVMAISSPHTLKGDSLFGVEMKIPFWTGNYNDFASGNSMFISWGYNHYPDVGKLSCDSTPIVYRWAKHYKTYKSGEMNKPYGWRMGDSTHFDPTRSWDGWGRFTLGTEMVSGTSCRIAVQDTGSWALSLWARDCQPPSTSIRNNPKSLKRQAHPALNFTWDLQMRDLRGRDVPVEVQAHKP